MSTIRQTPYIEELLASMSEQNLNDLKTILDSGGNNVNLDFEHLIADTYKNKVTPVYFKFEDNGLKTGILIWTDTKCALICYHRFQDLIIFELDPTYHTYEKIKQYCDINELRRVLDDTIEKTGAIDSGDADKGQIPVADGEGGVEWKDNFQELVLTNQSGTLTDDEIALAKEGNTVARLGSDGQFYYKDAQNNYYVIFKAAARVANDDTIVEKITIDLSDNTYSYSYDVVAAGESFTPTYDDELSDASTNAVQNKVVTKALNDTVADIESGRTIVGKATTAQALDNVSENSGSTQEDPFIAQGTGTNNNTSETPTSPKAHQLEKQGNTVCVNQWNDTITDTVNMTNGASYKELRRVPLANAQNDKVLVIGKIDFSLSPNANINVAHFNISATGHSAYIDTNVSVVNGMFAKVFTLDYANSSIYLFAFANTTFGSGESVTYSDYYVINLNQWGFDSDTLTYLTAHPEAFINYYNGSLAYNTGQLVSSDGQYLVTIGFNQLNPATSDNEQFIGNYYIQGSSQDYVREANNSYNCYRIRICHYDITDTEYCITKNKNEILGSVGIVRFVDKDYNLISGNESSYSATKYNVISVPTNAEYMEIAIPISADFKVCVNLSWDKERSGEYVDFVKHVYDTGTEPLFSVGNVKNIKLADGTITKNVNQKVYASEDVTLGYEYLNVVYYAIPKPSDYVGYNSYISAIGTISCDKYNVISALDDWNSANGIGTINGQANDSSFWIGFDVGTTLAQAQSAINGLHLNYELATPTTEQGTPFDEIIDVDDYGTMYWLDDNEDFVEVPQGCKLFYPADYALLIDDLGNYTNYDVNVLAKKSDLTDFVKIHCHSLRLSNVGAQYTIRIFANAFTPTKTSLLTFANLLADMTANNYHEIICSGAVRDTTNSKNMFAIRIVQPDGDASILRLVCQDEDGNNVNIALTSTDSLTQFSAETII